MSSDTKAIIGTIVGTGVAVMAVTITLIGGVRSDMRDLRAEMRDLRAEMRDLRAEMRSDMRDLRAEARDEMGDMRETLERFDERLDAIEVTLGKVVQRLSTLERVVLPAPPPPDQEPEP